MRVRAIAAVALVVAVPACGGDDESSGQPAVEPSSASPKPSQGPSAGPDLPGESAPADLSDFSCEPRAGGGDWRASGTLTSPTARSDYRVRVAVTPPAEPDSNAAGSGPAKARQRFVSGVRKQKPRDFEFGHVPADSADGTCRVQVVRLD